MKKIILATVLFFITITVFAQKTMPTLEVGSTAKIQLNFLGRDIDGSLTLKEVGETITIDWDIVSTGGSIAMKASALENGTKFFGGQPVPDETTKLADNETFMCISKAAYQSMVKNKTFVYGPLTYLVKDAPEGFKMDGKLVDATYAVTADGKTSLWVLNKADYPMTLAMKGNTTGADYTFLSVK